MRFRAIATIILSMFVAIVSFAQGSQPAVPTVPRQLRFGGTVKSADGTPRTGMVGVMFSLYSEQQGSTALWTELQNVQLDANGQYSVLLGSQHAEGVPADLFTTNEARWLGIQVEAEPEQARVLLVSVPYALKAGDAETLGGKPLSAFLLNPNATENGAPTGTATTTQAASSGVQTYSVNTSTSGGTANIVAKWIDASTLGNSAIFESGGFVGIGTTSPATLLHIAVDANFRSDVGAAMMIGSSTTPAKRLMFGYDTTSDAGYIQATQAGVDVKPLLFNPGGGFVGLGTSTPQAIMHVAQDSSYTSDLASAIIVSNKTNTNKRMMFGYDASIDASYIQSTFSGVDVRSLLFNPSGGNVGIGTTVAGQKLTVAGVIQSTTGGFRFPDGSTMTSATNNTAPTSYTSSTTDQVLHATQNGAGAGSLTIATLPSAVRGDASASTGFISGVLGSSASPSGFGVFGENTASSGNAIGTFGVSTTSTTGTGVWGEAEATTGDAVGVYGKSFSTTGTGIFGYANATSGDAVGVYGRSDSILGTGAWGNSTATSGVTFGVYGSVASASGTAGVFDNAAAGDLLLGRQGITHLNVFRVDSTGKGFFNGGTQTGGADFAESVEVLGKVAQYEAGDVMAIDPAGKRRLALTNESYSTRVAGIYSTKPGVLASPHGMDDPKFAGEIPLALVGIVPCKVSAENGPIKAGDLLVSASIPGYAMKGTDRTKMAGAVVGKALDNLDSGTGVIQVLVSLQ
jgi:hypothetical protein